MPEESTERLRGRSRRTPPAAPKRLELEAWSRGLRYVAGVDEVGRGPLAGPVVAAAVIFPPDVHIPHVTDSKLLRPEEREELAERIRAEALAWGVGLVPAPLIDAINILRATHVAMREAIRSLDPAPEMLLVDGRALPDIEFPQVHVIGGDRRSFVIAAASILAKTHRDRIMEHLDALYPQYGFAGHKGYASAEHLRAIGEHGPCPAHRLSFSPFAGEAQGVLEFGEDEG
ncbi:ribonuclease HII [bacterium]|nr:ribonuclease HII [bacterium]